MARDKGKREIHDSVGARIKFLREQKHLSLKDLENKTGISASYLNRLEKGERKSPGCPIMFKLADALDVSVFELLHLPVEADKPKTLFDLLILHNYTVKGVPATRRVKDAIIVLVQTVVNADLTGKNQLHDSMLIIERAKELRNALGI
ncbi:helix-turn-helix domain-containing protein [Alicyclobacillus shizuokensis]|uniref:helix-turn-helix domain-containing protein n=1 Tax=Alicyclobacillus shizuokensis TaxID=392014 RepID=UPI00082F4989|nr:helix-turn-helix transcriptional regulator [Alicyclobacillus shizuokensis]